VNDGTVGKVPVIVDGATYWVTAEVVDEARQCLPQVYPVAFIFVDPDGIQQACLTCQSDEFVRRVDAAIAAQRQPELTVA